VLLHPPDRLLFDTNTQLVYAKAQSNLGIAYAFGKGVLKDDKKAMYWYQKAADQGQAQTQFNLGVKYAFGKGVLKDDVYNLLTRLCQKHT
jgi:TPR repeat protein